MEYIRGVNLETLLQKNTRLTPARVGRLISQLCEVLQAAHDQALIHRDLKPANLMVVDHDSPREKIKVMDFGLAKLVDTEAAGDYRSSSAEFAVGTPGYICPEQVKGEPVDHRGDLYSVGVMMFEVLKEWLSGWTQYWYGVLGLVFIVATLFFPKGLVGELQERYDQWRQRDVRRSGRIS